MSPVDQIRVERDDVEQEAALLVLEGKKPNRRIIWKRLARSEAIFDEVPVGGSLLWSNEQLPDISITEALVDFALKQTEEVQDAILDFLDAPSDDDADRLIAYLQDLGVILRPALPQKMSKRKARKLKLADPHVHKEIPLSQFVLDALSRRPHYKNELYDIARQLQPSNRPEAAVRQLLRRLVRNKTVTVLGDIVSLSQPEEEL